MILFCLKLISNNFLGFNWFLKVILFLGMFIIFILDEKIIKLFLVIV